MDNKMRHSTVISCKTWQLLLRHYPKMSIFSKALRLFSHFCFSPEAQPVCRHLYHLISPLPFILTPVSLNHDGKMNGNWADQLTQSVTPKTHILQLPKRLSNEPLHIKATLSQCGGKSLLGFFYVIPQSQRVYNLIFSMV